MAEVHQHPQGGDWGLDHMTLCWPMRGLETNCRGRGHQTFHTIKIRTFIDFKPHMKYIDEVETLTLHRPAWLLQCSFDCSSEWVSSFNHTRRYGPLCGQNYAERQWPLAEAFSQTNTLRFTYMHFHYLLQCNATQCKQKNQHKILCSVHDGVWVYIGVIREPRTDYCSLSCLIIKFLGRIYFLMHGT